MRVEEEVRVEEEMRVVEEMRVEASLGRADGSRAYSRNA